MQGHAALSPAVGAAKPRVPLPPGPCVRVLFTFGLPDESLEGAGAVALFSLEQ